LNTKFVQFYPSFTFNLLYTMSNVLEYVKTVLQKVSFDRVLFEKELRKGLQMLVTDDVSVLRTWCYEKFSDRYQTILNQYFNQTTLSVS
jgi:hypothetical protein